MFIKSHGEKILYHLFVIIKTRPNSWYQSSALTFVSVRFWESSWYARMDFLIGFLSSTSS